ncbi:MAG: HypC/HybG/HupF family hydrogenase formation chaperone [Polyangiaceae bacterium]
MCLAIPMRLIEVQDVEGTVELSGVQRTVRLDLVPDAAVGDWVIIHAGYAIQHMDEALARETLALVEAALGAPPTVEREDEERR